MAFGLTHSKSSRGSALAHLKCALGAHDWARDCEKCSRCGKARSESHDWASDCEKCSRCGARRPGSHAWSGSKCPRCGKARSESLDARDNHGNTPLHLATIFHHDRILSLLEDGANVNAKNSDGNTPLHLAVEVRAYDSEDHYRFEHARMIEALLAYGADVNALNNKGQTPLGIGRSVHWWSWEDGNIPRLLRDSGGYNFARDFPKIAKEGDLAKIQTLLNRHPELLSLKDANDRTFLHVAASNGCGKVVELLLANKADINAVGTEELRTASDRLRTVGGCKPLHAAALHGHQNVVELLLGHGAEADARDSSGGTALMVASEFGHGAVVEALLARGAEVDARAHDGRTALMEACRRGHADVVRVLLDRGADVNATAKNDYTALMLATEGGHRDVVELLLKNGADVNASSVAGAYGNTALGIASRVYKQPPGDCDKDMVDLLRRYGATVVRGNIITASSEGRAEEVDTLLKRNPKLAWEQESYTRSMPLHVAAREGHKGVVEAILAHKFDVNTKAGGWTALHWAAEKGRKDVAEFLLAKGADPTAKNGDHRTPLQVAAYKCQGRPYRHDDYERVAELLRQASGRDPKGGFHVALETGDLQLIGALLDATPSLVEIRDDDGRTPLHCAATRGRRALAELLLAANAEANARTDWGATPLHLAAHNGRGDVVELLLARGAEVNCRDDLGVTPLRAAIDQRHPEIAELLRRQGGCE